MLVFSTLFYIFQCCQNKMFNMYVLILLILTITLMLTCGLIKKLFLAVEYMVPVAVLFQQVHVFLCQTLKIVIAHVQVFALNTRDKISKSKNSHLIGSFAYNIFVFFGSHPILKQHILNSMLWGFIYFAFQQ